PQERTGDSRESDESRTPQVDVATRSVRDRAGQRDHADGNERRPGGGPYRQADDSDEERHGDDAAADAKEGAEEPGHDADQQETKHGPYSPARARRARRAPDVATTTFGHRPRHRR